MDSNYRRKNTRKVYEVLRWLYFPYMCLVFLPFLAITTILFGIIAGVIGIISPRAAFYFGTVWAWCLCLVNFTWVSVRGVEHITKGQSYVIMCNHQSYFDVLAFYGHWRHQFRWVMKQELSKVPLMGWGCKQIGHIFIDRSNTKRAIASLHKAKSLLQRGISVVFFPEGQRSRNGRLQEFKKGGFILAQEIKLPILPVSISGSYRILPSKTYKLLPGHISICIHAPINTTAYSSQELTRIMFETRKRIADGLMD